MKTYPLSLPKRSRFGLLVLLLAVIVLLFLPVRPIVSDVAQTEISSVTLYDKGQPRKDVSAYLKLDDLAFHLQLFHTSIVPSVPRGQRVGENYYVIEGNHNGRSFSITADGHSAFMFYLDQNRGYRLKNGAVVVGMIFSSAHDDFRNELTPIPRY